MTTTIDLELDHADGKDALSLSEVAVAGPDLFVAPDEGASVLP